MGGDCLYIPGGWYHQVRAGLSRTINVHMWYWRPERFNDTSCALDLGQGVRTLFDCAWGYTPPRGSPSPPRGVASLERMPSPTSPPKSRRRSERKPPQVVVD